MLAIAFNHFEFTALSLTGAWDPESATSLKYSSLSVCQRTWNRGRVQRPSQRANFINIGLHVGASEHFFGFFFFLSQVTCVPKLGINSNDSALCQIQLVWALSCTTSLHAFLVNGRVRTTNKVSAADTQNWRRAAEIVRVCVFVPLFLHSLPAQHVYFIIRTDLIS